MKNITLGNVTVYTEKLGDINTKSTHESNDKKINLKILNEDLSLLNHLASDMGISRSNLINSLILKILKKELRSIEDIDTQALIAFHADQKFQPDNSSSSWKHDVLIDINNRVFSNCLYYNKTDEFIQQDDYLDSLEDGYNSESFKNIKKIISGEKQ